MVWVDFKWETDGLDSSQDADSLEGISAGAVCTKASSQRAHKMLKDSI